MLVNRTYRKLLTLQAQTLTVIEQLETLRSGQAMLSQQAAKMAVAAPMTATTASAVALRSNNVWQRATM